MKVLTIAALASGAMTLASCGPKYEWQELDNHFSPMCRAALVGSGIQKDQEFDICSCALKKLQEKHDTDAILEMGSTEALVNLDTCAAEKGYLKK